MADLPGFSATDTQGNSSTIGSSGSNTNSTTDVTNTINNLVKSLQATTSDTITNQDTSGTSNTTGKSTANTTGLTTNTGVSTTGSSADAINLTKGIALQGLSNSVNTSKTDDLVGNIIKQAAISFAPTRVATNNTGSYNSTSVGELSDNAAALATGQAAGAVLNYQTAQSQIANSAAEGLLGATKTTTDANTSAVNTNTTGTNTSGTTSNSDTTGKSATTGTQATDTSTQASINTLTKLLSTVFSNSASTTNSSQQSAGLNLSIICTELHTQGKMDSKTWARGMVKFQKYPEYGKQGYFMWARPCVRELKEHPLSWKSRLIARVFIARAGGSWTARSAVTLTSFSLGLIWLMFFKKVQTEIELEMIHND